MCRGWSVSSMRFGNDSPTRWSGTRWAVTGATGLLGNNLVRRLVELGASVTVLARGGARRELDGLPLRVIAGDLSDHAALAACFAGAERVVHAAASVWVGSTRVEEQRRVNVDGTRAVCAALPAGARLVHVSTVDALGYGTREAPADEDSPPRPEEGGVGYVDTKREADRIVRESGLDHVIVYPTYLLGPWDWRPSSGRMVLEVARGAGRLAPPGANNFVDVRDVVEGLLAAADAPAGSRWILGGENLTYTELWTRIAAVTGARPPWGTLPRWLGPVAAAALAVPVALGMREREVNAVTTRFGFIDHCFSPARARAALGLPSTPLETTLRDCWAWFQAHGYR